MPKKFTYWLILLFCNAFSLVGQNVQEIYEAERIQQNNFDESKWSSTIEGIDYSGDVKKKKKEKQQEEGTSGNSYRTRPEESSSRFFNTDGAMLVLKIFCIIIGAILLAFLLKGLLGLSSAPRNRKIKDSISSSIDIKKIEENIHESDLDHFIKEALKEGNFSLAIRLYYLAGLKELSLQKAIKWKKDKTNRAYLNEMQQNPMFESFRQITHIFERVWYGKAQLEERDYKQIEPAFKQFINRINRKTA